MDLIRKRYSREFLYHKPENSICKEILKKVDKFISAPFTYKELYDLINNFYDFLYLKDIRDKIDGVSYSALFSLLNDIEEEYASFKGENLVIATKNNNIDKMYSVNYYAHLTAIPINSEEAQQYLKNLGIK